ncbi:MAG: S1 family peptidase [Myxococcaceae bacterium]|nr:S1 family peptidase [Myxococcaceae bacterium]
MRRLLFLFISVTAAGCGPVLTPGGTEASRAPIVGGSPSLDDPQVFALGKSGQGMSCTATLIGERTLLTAAHCLEGGTTMSASNQGDVRGWPANAIAITEVRVHPKWATGNSDYDVGLVLLASAPAVTPKAWNRVPLTLETLPQVRAVGYGETHADGNGVRMQVMLDVTSMSATTLMLGSSSGASTCFGDSGGPSLHRGPDSIERVVGVHSFATSAACNGGGDIRVDLVADFIDQWTRDKAPTCAVDGACATGCSEPDLDCNCLTDGMCSATCPLPDTDRDCPKGCLADGVCAIGSCGVPDPDCRRDGDACGTSEICPGRQCLTDASHPNGYCSRTCKDHDVCEGQMRCTFGVCRYPVNGVASLGEACTIGQTFCTDGVCGGPAEDLTTCRPACSALRSCPAGEVCIGGVRGIRYCQGEVTLQSPRVELPAAPGGCSVVAGGELMLLAVLVLVRSLRRER